MAFFDEVLNRALGVWGDVFARSNLPTFRKDLFGKELFRFSENPFTMNMPFTPSVLFRLPVTRPVSKVPAGGWTQKLAEMASDVDQIVSSLSEQHGVPLKLVRAIMMAESGGNPRAVGDNGASVGLFQLHERGLGAGLTVAQRMDPRINASVAIPKIAAAYRQAVAQGLSGEELVRFVYDRAINPGGGWGYQGDAVMRFYRG